MPHGNQVELACKVYLLNIPGDQIELVGFVIGPAFISKIDAMQFPVGVLAAGSEKIRFATSDVQHPSFRLRRKIPADQLQLFAIRSG